MLVFSSKKYYTKLYRLNPLWKFQKRELQHFTVNRLSDIDFKDFMKLYKKDMIKWYFFLVSDTTFVSEYYFYFYSSTFTHNTHYCF